MGRKKVVFFEVEPSEIQYFEDKLGSKAELVFFSEPLSEDNVHKADGAQVIVCFIYSQLNHIVINQLRSLKGIATMSVGFDHIDLHEANQRHIFVSNVPSYGPNTVAEHAAALLLCISRKIFPSVERTKGGEFDYRGLTGWDLFGKTIGILGTGKIGAHLTRIANGLGMKILAYDRTENTQLVRNYSVLYRPLNDVLRHADVISLHIPYTQENHYFLSRDQFNIMKKGMVVINTARGGLIDPLALIEALDNGQVSWAGIDVLEDEGILKEEKELLSPHFNAKRYRNVVANHVLMHHPKVLVTPHNAFNSVEALRNILQTTVENVEGILGSDPINLVEPK